MIFLRPWFLILALVPVILWFFKRHLSADNPLSHFVDKRLLPFLTVHFKTQTRAIRTGPFIVLWLLLVLAGAGPAFDKITVPAHVTAPATVIVLDLSPAMNGQNLTTAKLKLYDLLKALRGHQGALVLYDEKGYTAAPLTPDLEVIEGMIPALNPSVMPKRINRPAAGFQKAGELFANAGVDNGQIIFITAGGFDATGLEQTAAHMPHQIITLGIEGGDTGMPVPLDNGDFMRDETGAPILVKPDRQFLSAIGNYVPAETGDNDVRAIVARAPNTAADETGANANADIWMDTGPYFLLIAALLFMMLFRKGVLFVLVLGLPFSAGAGLFERPDQEQYRKMAAGVEAYRIGNFEAARQFFESGETADDLYNAGNARAYLNDIDGAIQAYEAALKQNPAHRDALYNKQYLERQRPPENQKDESNSDSNEQQKDADQSGNDQNESSSAKESNTDENQNEQSDSQNQTGENKSDQNPQSSEAAPENVSDESQSMTADENQDMTEEPRPVQNQEAEAQELPTPQPSEAGDYETVSQKPLDQESEQVFNKIKQDPSRLLRYRLYQQYMRQ